MATFTINIPDGVAPEVVEAFCIQYGRPETVDGPEGEQIPNPISKVTFAKNIVRSFVREVYVGSKVKALDATRQQIIETSNAETDAVTVD